MKLLLTSAGYEKNPIIGKEFLKLLNKNPSKIKVFLVTTAKRKEKDWKWVKFTLKQLEKLGILSVNVSIFSLNRRIKKEDLRDKDVIYVCGGNTFVYLDRIKKTGLDKKIKEFVQKNKIYFGVSAGSIIMGLNIESAGWKHADKNIINLKDLTGLKLVPFVIAPHIDKTNIKATKKCANKADYPVVALSDKQAVLVKGKIRRIVETGDKLIFNTTNRF